MILTAAQFLFEVDAAGDLRTQAAIDADNHRQHDDQDHQARQAVNQQIRPECPVIKHVADPVLLNLADFSGGHVRQDFVQNAHQYLVVTGYAHRQLIAIRCFAADVQAFEFQLTQAPYTGREITDYGVDFIGRKRLQGRADIGHGDQIQVGMVGAQEFMGRVVFHHGDLQAVQIVKFARLCATDVGEDDDGEVEVRTSERQISLTLRCRHDPGQQIDLALLDLLKHYRPAHGFDRGEFDRQTLAYGVYVVSCQALIARLIVAKLKGRPRRVDAQAQVWMSRQPATFFIGQSQRVSRCGPDHQ